MCFDRENINTCKYLLKKVFFQMDTDGNGKIDFEEFLVSMAERRDMHDSMEDLRKVWWILFPTA